MKQNFFGKFDPSKTAILVVDVQVDFCSPSGFASQFWKHNVSHFEEIIKKIRGFLEEVKKYNVDILYTQLIYDPQKISKALKRKLGDFVGKFAAPNTEGIEFYKIKPPKNKVFIKYGFSAFSSQKFYQYLKRNKIESLILVGFNSDICVESTARDAIDLGFYPIIVEDLVGAPTFLEKHEKETLFLFNLIFGDVTTSEKILSFWRRRN